MRSSRVCRTGSPFVEALFEDTFEEPFELLDFASDGCEDCVDSLASGVAAAAGSGVAVL